MSDITCQHPVKFERGRRITVCGRDAMYLVATLDERELPVCAHHSLVATYTDRRRIIQPPARDTVVAQTEEAVRAGPEPAAPPFGHDSVTDVEVEYVVPLTEEPKKEDE